MYVPEQVHRVADRGGGGALARAHQRRAAALRRRLGRQARSAGVGYCANSHCCIHLFIKIIKNSE